MAIDVDIYSVFLSPAYNSYNLYATPKQSIIIAQPTTKSSSRLDTSSTEKDTEKETIMRAVAGLQCQWQQLQQCETRGLKCIVLHIRTMVNVMASQLGQII
ncbi:hypothetical protein ACLKA7_009569 [Drosophila subpalustris]